MGVCAATPECLENNILHCVVCESLQMNFLCKEMTLKNISIKIIFTDISSPKKWSKLWNRFITKNSSRKNQPTHLFFDKVKKYDLHFKYEKKSSIVFCLNSIQEENEMIKMKFACVILILSKYLVSRRLKCTLLTSEQWVHHGTLHRPQLSVLDELESAAIFDFRDKVPNPLFVFVPESLTQLDWRCQAVHWVYL